MTNEAPHDKMQFWCTKRVETSGCVWTCTESMRLWCVKDTTFPPSILEDMTGAKVFSKLDLKWGHHQIELKLESRSLTKFVTHTGLWRYKRLMFGISSTPETYQHIIRHVLQGINGVHNISDDTIVFGKNVQVHNVHLY